MREITKWFPETEVLANDRAALSAEPGRIHGLVGENGAGKSTLMKILDGEVHPDGGTIRLGGERVWIRSPRDAARLGVGMVHQSLRIIPELTVAENVLLGREPSRLGFLDREEAGRIVRETAGRFGIGTGLDPQRKVGSLEAGEQQQVEILRLLSREARLLVFDEPTSLLTEQQKERLFLTLRRFADQGHSVVLITHNVEDVLSVADVITVMRQGRTVATLDSADCDRSGLTQLMVGHEVLAPRSRRSHRGGEVLLAVESCVAGKREEDARGGISFEVRAGEVLALTGTAGSGLREIEDIISGMRRPVAGLLRYRGRAVDPFSDSSFRRKTLAYVPSQRVYRGAALEATVMENLLVNQRDGKGFWLNEGARRERAATMLEDFGIAASPGAPMRTLSGGNRQRVVLARELDGAKPVALFAEPTWGIDVDASAFIHRRILRLSDLGKAVILISSDLEEVLELADRIIVLRRGRVVARLFNTPGLGKRTLGSYLLGLEEQAA
jgi:simple sugar transport system ATP-binding protein